MLNKQIACLLRYIKKCALRIAEGAFYVTSPDRTRRELLRGLS